mmetsp:Transcript_18980/g.41352  ORF Transcript_18980/g.41352 Transcript_18980/m.41352 type:complete len:355 (+) Transcript_18980:86-1150(+)
MASRAAASAARMQVISVTSAVRAGRTATSSSTSTASRNLSSNVQTGGQAQFQHTQHTQHKHTQQEGGLSTLGTLFFGSLCASTFGLGVWQSRRYFEKIDQVERRELELAADPVELDRFTIAAADAANDDDDDDNIDEDTTEDSAAARTTASYRRLITRGEFMHDDEVLVGPRGPPPGALASSGPSSGRSSGGMASSPQGYFVITPMRCSDGRGTILVNRGWVPMSYYKQDVPWSRPAGTVAVVGVETKTEQPKFLSPEHDKRNPKTLLWMDRVAIEETTGTKGLAPLLLTETIVVNNDEPSGNDAPLFPVRPNAETVGEFKVTPFTHAGYAVTWFGLSSAGMFMTRKLMTRGRA